MFAKPNRLPDCQTARLSDCQTIELVNPANLPDNYICQFDLQSFWCVVRSAFLRVRLTLWVQRGVCVIFVCKTGSKQATLLHATWHMWHAFLCYYPTLFSFCSQPKLIAARTETFVKHFNNH